MTKEKLEEIHRERGHNDARAGHPPGTSTLAYLKAYAEALAAKDKYAR